VEGGRAGKVGAGRRENVLFARPREVAARFRGYRWALPR
jgi:hypothetical protein